MSKSRPIHSLNRELRKQQSPAEPSFPLEQEAVSYEEKAADEFHRKLAGTYRRDTSSNPVNGVSPRNSWNNTGGQNGGRESSGSGSNSFWRGSTSSNSDPSSHLTNSLTNIASRFNLRGSGSLAESGSTPFANADNVDQKTNPNNNQKMETPTMKSTQSTRSAPEIQQQYQQGNFHHQQSSLSKDSSKIKNESDKQRFVDRGLTITDVTDNDVHHIDLVDEDVGQSNQFERVVTSHPGAPPIPSTVIVNPHSQSSTLKSPSVDNSNYEYSQNRLSNNIPTTIAINSGPPMPPITSFPLKPGQSSTLDRSSSDQSTGSLLYCKTPNSTGLFGKSASLIFPTGVDASGATVAGAGNMGATKLNRTSTAGSQNDGMGEEMNEAAAKAKRAKIEMALDQCESVRFPFKKKLILHNLKLRAADIPLQELIGTPLGNALNKLDLSGNRLGSIPARLVQNLPVLKSLDLSQCALTILPEKWHLPKLTKLNLSQNRFSDFPEESMLEGLPDLQELDMYGNIVKVISVPTNPKVLSRLETLNLGYNDLVFLPPELDKLKSLRVLKVMNNFLAKVPMRVCEMDLKIIDVSSNPITEPPIETCERGICSMRRYWHCIRMEEQSKTRAVKHQKQVVESQPIFAQQQMQPSGGGGKYLRFMNPIKKISEMAQIQNNRHKSVSSHNSSNSGSSVDNVTAAVSASTVPVSHGKVPYPTSIYAQDQRQTSDVSTSSGQSGLPPIPPVKLIPENLTIHENKMTHDIEPNLKEQEERISNTQTYQQDMELMGSLLLDEAAIDAIDENMVEIRDEITVNDTLKVIFVGMAMVGKTSMIKRLIEGEDAEIPSSDERTIGVDIYEWEPKLDQRFEHIDSRIEFQDKDLADACGDVEVKFSVWDFAGQHVYHATHELFFSSRALYVLVWDMGATNDQTLRRKVTPPNGNGKFSLVYESSDEEGDGEEDLDLALAVDTEARRADRALERDIDDKVQFWVDCIQSSAPGAAILPVASFDDYFTDRLGGEAEARRRCNMLKQRLLRHEERRIQGLEQRLQEYVDQNRANDVAAIRLRKLVCQYRRPKLIFGDDEENSVVRVSGTKYTGFDRLTEKVIGIATGRNKGQWTYPIFHGHVGARIPRMRLDVRDAVRSMRDRFKVVEWGYFLNCLREQGLTGVEDISDALHFLTNTGELSYFGSVMEGGSSTQMVNPVNTDTSKEPRTYKQNGSQSDLNVESIELVKSGELSDDDDDENAFLSMDDTSITAPSTLDGSLTTVDDFMSAGLSQYVFLNPRWLVAAVACILRHDLDREIKETRRTMAAGGHRDLARTASFFDAYLNCPVITASDACMLWNSKRITKKAAERAEEYSNNMSITPFEFLQRLLIRFGVFVPIDLSIEKASFAGKDYQVVDNSEDAIDETFDPSSTPTEITYTASADQIAGTTENFFLPSLLGPCDPSDSLWTYKNTDSWKTTLCHSILFPDGVPPGLMERLTASVLSSIYAVSKRQDSATSEWSRDRATYEGKIYIKEVLCWRTAFYLKIGTQVISTDGSKSESMVEIFTQLANRESHLCVGSDYMEVGARRLILSGRGQEGDGGRKIWKGGYLLVIKCINRVMAAYDGLEFENQGFCPECLAKVPVSKASSWEMTRIREAITNSERTLRCKHHGHPVDTRLVAGPIDFSQRAKPSLTPNESENNPMDSISTAVAVRDIQLAVVVVGLWDGKERKVTRVGSGFIVDKKRGLVVTAAHTLINVWGDPQYPYGENYYGLPQGKVVIGVIPAIEDNSGAVFRYFAKIVAKCSYLDRGECQVDACVLRITTRMETDVGGDGSGCGDVPEILLLNNQKALKNERLQSLKMSERCELDEQVRVLGYNQGGEGVVNPGEILNRFIDLSRGYVSKKFVHAENIEIKRRDRFKPREEIVVSDCRTIGGHSGGPCVNQQGEVIGILSRADPADNQRCYLVPSSELKALVNQARKQM